MNKPLSRRNVSIGEIYLMQFKGRENEQKGLRPGLVFQNNIGNNNSPNIIALPLTSAIKKETQPTHVFLKAKDSGLRKDSIVLCENPECMSKTMIGEYITTLSDSDMRHIAEASLLATSAVAYLDRDTLLSVWKRATAMNHRHAYRRSVRV